MSSGDWFALQLVAGIVGAALGVLSALLLALDVMSPGPRQAALRTRLAGWLAAVRASSWARLPQTFLALAGALQARLRGLTLAATGGRVAAVVATLAALACVGVVVTRFGQRALGLLVVWILLAIASNALPASIRERRWFRVVADGGGLLLAALGGYALLELAVRQAPSPWALVLALPLPAIALVIADFVVTAVTGEAPSAADDAWSVAYTVGAGIGFSAVATVGAVALGHVATAGVGGAAQPALSFQALAINLAADTATLLGFAALLRRRGPLLGWLLVATAWAALTAALGLYLAFVGTPDALTPLQVARVLVAQAPGGGGVELGSYFFLMHTTFLPLAGFALFLVFALLVKGLTKSVETTLDATAQPTLSPYKVAAALVGVLIAAFVGAATIAGLLKDRASALEAQSAAAGASVPPAEAARRAGVAP